VTKLLISKEEMLRQKQQRLVLFGQDGPLPDISEKDEDESSQSSVPLIDKLREDLAHNKLKQLELQHQLKIPDFELNEQVVVDENDVSDDSDVDEDKKNQAKKEDQYKRFKERINRGKNKDKNVRGGRLISASFKFMNTVIGILNDVRLERNGHRDQGLVDFKNAINLYNEVLRGWLIRCAKTPILTIIKERDESFDFIPLDGAMMRDKTRRDRFLALRIRVNTIFQNLILNATPKIFP